MNSYEWYAELLKPSWAPPAWLFGPVWTLLYFVIAVTFTMVFFKVYQREIPWIVAVPFVINLLSNFAFTPLQFGLRSNALASVDILIVLGSLIWALVVVRPYLPVVTYANIPYLLWVMFATVLQLTVTFLNR